MMCPLPHSHPWFPTPAFTRPTPHAKQLLLSSDGSNPVPHWQSKEAGSAVVETFMALATHEQLEELAAVVLLRAGHGAQEPASPMEGLYVEGRQGTQSSPFEYTSPLTTVT